MCEVVVEARYATAAENGWVKENSPGVAQIG